MATGGAVGLLFICMPHQPGAAGRTDQRTDQQSDQLPIDQRWPLPRSQRGFPARHCIQLWTGLEGYSWLEPHIRTLPDLPGSGVATATTPALHIICRETQEPANTGPVRQPGRSSSRCRPQNQRPASNHHDCSEDTTSQHKKQSAPVFHSRGRQQSIQMGVAHQRQNYQQLQG